MRKTKGFVFKSLQHYSYNLKQWSVNCWPKTVDNCWPGQTFDLINMSLTSSLYLLKLVNYWILKLESFMKHLVYNSILHVRSKWHISDPIQRGKKCFIMYMNVYTHSVTHTFECVMILISTFIVTKSWTETGLANDIRHSPNYE